MRMLSFKDIDHLGCIDCEYFDGGNPEAGIGKCLSDGKEFCKRYFDARL